MDFLDLRVDGGPVAVLCNGPSLPFIERLEQIKIPTLGMNRTWNFPSTYYLTLEQVWLGVGYEGRYFLNAACMLDPTWPKAGYHVPLQWKKRFSYDPEFGFYPGTTGYLAGEVALGLGFDEVHYLGLDLCGDHFDGTHAALMHESLELFELMAEGLKGTDRKVYVCSSPRSACKSFPHSEFERLM